MMMVMYYTWIAGVLTIVWMRIALAIDALWRCCTISQRYVARKDSIAGLCELLSLVMHMYLLV